ncbi:MAG: glycosyltransferase [Pseudomonadota bacterium]
MSALVAIVTRTKDRPQLLKRAAKSVAAQTFDDYIWVVVNDGGDEAQVRNVLEACPVEPARIRFFSNPASLGMEAASNVGIRQTSSKYLMVHDDDDTLHPDFLSETVRFLESPAGQAYGGVSTRVDYVSEEINGEEIAIHHQTPYMDWVQSVDFAEILAQNLITTISFLYRRELFDEIGGYNESLPVLGDWFFNVEFVLRSDIKILDQTLAYYHHRDRGQNEGIPSNSNSVIARRSAHIENAARCRNALIRKYRDEGGVVSAVVAGYFAHTQRHPQSRVTSDVPRAIGEGAEFELDRLWLLANILNEKSKLAFFSKRKLPSLSMTLSLSELAHIAKEHRFRVEVPGGFDEARYLEIYPDVADEVNSGGFRSGYEHYVLHGHLEERDRPSC